MRKKNIIQTNVISDLDQIILNLWDQKKKILLFVFVSLILNYFLITSKIEKTFRTEISIQRPNFSIYPRFDGFLKSAYNRNNISASSDDMVLTNIFYQIFINQINSKNNLFVFTDIFLNKYENADHLLKNKTKNLVKLGRVVDSDKNKVLEKYYLLFPEHFKGEIFLNEYISYSQKVVNEIIKDKMMEKLNAELIEIEKNFKIAKEIKLFQPVMLPPVDSDGISKAPINEPRSLYYQGVHVLQNEMDFIKNLRDDLKEAKLSYEPVVDSANETVQISRNILVYNIFAIIIGFFFSVIFNYLKTIFNRE